MTIRLTLSTDRLQDPAVARALARFFLELAESPVTDHAMSRSSHRPEASTAAGITYAEFEAGLTGNTRRFLQLLRERGTLTLSEAQKALGIASPKAVGGITGAIGRWAPAKGLELPYQMFTTPAGERAWRWTGPTDVDVPDEGAAPARRSSSTRRAARTARSLPSDPAERLARLRKALPEQARRFLDLLEERRRVATAEVLDHLGLARAQALSPLLAQLDELAEKHGVVPAYEVSVTPTGERFWLWPGTPVEVEEPVSAARRSEAPTPRILPFQEAPSPLRPDAPLSAGKPGVYKRSPRAAR